MMKMLRATRVDPPLGAQMAFERVAQPLGWFGLGVLTAGVAAWALLRSGRGPSTGEEPDGQEPDVLLDVSQRFALLLSHPPFYACFSSERTSCTSLAYPWRDWFNFTANRCRARGDLLVWRRAYGGGS